MTCSQQEQAVARDNGINQGPSLARIAVNVGFVCNFFRNHAMTRKSFNDRPSVDAELASSKASGGGLTGSAAGLSKEPFTDETRRGRINGCKIPKGVIVRQTIQQAIDHPSGRQQIRIVFKKIGNKSNAKQEVDDCKDYLDAIGEEQARAPFHDQDYLDGLKLNLLVLLYGLLGQFNIRYVTYIQENSIAVVLDSSTSDFEFKPTHVEASQETFLDQLGLWPATIND
jgi:hypothetical protein